MNASYFQHDYYAREDPKIKLLLRKHGVAGYGVFWIIIEQMHECLGSIQEWQVQMIAEDYKVDPAMMKDIVENFDLFMWRKINGKRYLESKRVNANFRKRKEIALARSAAAAARWEKAENEDEDDEKR